MTQSHKSNKSTPVASNRRITLSNLHQRWGKFDDVELAAIRSSGDLVRQIQATYGLDRAQAQTNVDIWAHGRQF